ncbi:MAG TPA: hypothetical protein VGD58_20630 [Herpetosiphonaceae bacterium]
MLDIYRKTKDGQIILGKGLPAFIHNGNYHQVTIKVYADGLIDCWQLVDLDGFKQKIREGWVVTQVPAGKRISCHHLFYGSATLNCYVEIDEFVKEVEDTVRELQGQPTSSRLCKQAFETYLRQPSSDHQAALREAYERVPKHLRVYVLHDMDAKDGPIKRTISAHPLDAATLASYRQWYLRDTE